MITQLNPMIPIYRVSDNMEGYAFLVIDYSQEHNLLFTCAMDDGELWTLNNKEIKFCKNISLDRDVKKPKIVKKLTNYKKYTKKDMIDFAEYTFQTYWEDSASKMLKDWIAINNK